jgi:hypothetical protein
VPSLSVTKRYRSSAPEILVEKVERTLPGELGSGFIITGSRIVMETLIRAVVDVPV